VVADDLTEGAEDVVGDGVRHHGNRG
jgi:hypothetical protein